MGPPRAILNQEESQAVDERAERWKEEDATGNHLEDKLGGEGGGLVSLYLQLQRTYPYSLLVF